jgi:hypothetical protein
MDRCRIEMSRIRRVMDKSVVAQAFMPSSRGALEQQAALPLNMNGSRRGSRVSQKALAAYGFCRRLTTPPRTGAVSISRPP